MSRFPLNFEALLDPFYIDEDQRAREAKLAEENLALVKRGRVPRFPEDVRVGDRVMPIDEPLWMRGPGVVMKIRGDLVDVEFGPSHIPNSKSVICEVRYDCLAIVESGNQKT